MKNKNLGRTLMTVLVITLLTTGPRLSRVKQKRSK